MYLTKAELRKDHRAILTFETGEVRIIDFNPVLKSLKNAAAAIVDASYFIRGNAEDGFLQWDNGYAIDPDALYSESKPYSVQQTASFLAKVSARRADKSNA